LQRGEKADPEEDGEEDGEATTSQLLYETGLWPAVAGMLGRMKYIFENQSLGNCGRKNLWKKRGISQGEEKGEKKRNWE